MDFTTGPVTWAGGYVTPTSFLNITNNNLIFRQASGVSLANVKTLCYSGEYLGTLGYWDGPGIRSSSAQNDPNAVSTIGYIDNSLFGYTSFNTVTGLFGFDPGILNGVNPDILVKTTWYGDATLDGYVTLDDYGQWNANFGLSGSWLDGDFDADGSVTLDDYGLWNYAFGFTAGGTVAYTAFADTPPKSGGAVPEPGSLGLLAIGAMGLLGNRRKRTAGK